MKTPRKRPLSIRVEYEPNRFSKDCLEKIYAQLNPTKSSKASEVKDDNHDETASSKKAGDQP